MKAPVLMTRPVPGLDAAAAWYAARSQREQILLAGLGVLLAGTVLWLLMLRPLLEARTASVARIAAYEEVMVRVRTAGPPGPMVAGLDGPLETAIPNQAATFGVVPTVTMDGDVATVTVSEGRYDSLIPWLSALETSGANLSSVELQRGSQPGAVNATLRVERP
ncbi:type II secretion system protein GspM [Brevundimonas sp.]|jgi:general secretion pathway protein M|uniref:type II secretion system protein GspM n=1 Tax=Brevundimonas sp. TaxID=1871086 RepID=UPI00391DCE88|nr:type II secretion system protein M [Brevundimonas sp.]MCA3718081.1 type II secretion system protein M [Brevundimonas sp.]